MRTKGVKSREGGRERERRVREKEGASCRVAAPDCGTGARAVRVEQFI